MLLYGERVEDKVFETVPHRQHVFIIPRFLRPQLRSASFAARRTAPGRAYVADRIMRQGLPDFTASTAIAQTFFNRHIPSFEAGFANFDNPRRPGTKR